MKLLVFGATGGTGRLVVQQALSKNIQVTAFVRDSAKMGIRHPRLRIVEGDVFSQPGIDAAMQGQDAVICCIGAPATRAGRLRSEGTQNIVDSMQRFGLSRFICQTSLGYEDSLPLLQNTPFVFKKLVVPLLLKKTFEDHARQEQRIKQSPLDWTIVRPGSLTNTAFTGRYKYGNDYNDPSWKVKISRADVADFLLAQLDETLYHRETVGVSY